MLKRFSRMLIAFVLLVAAYGGYTRAFAILASLVERRSDVPKLPPTVAQAQSSKEATDLAVSAFGPDHWAVRAPFRYINRDAGYWLFWENHVRLNEGKTWEFRPVAVIICGKGGELKTITGDHAVLNFNRPFDVSKPGDEPPRVTHAMIRGNVRIRDDKGTSSLADDVKSDPFEVLEFDETLAQLYSRSEQRLVIHQGGTTISGISLTMDLFRGAPMPPQPGTRPAPGSNSGGFDGVRRIKLDRDVVIDVLDVGRSGIVPGGAKVATTITKDGKATTAKAEPRPGRIQCAGAMVIDLPPPILQPRVGPPAPPLPTIAVFDRNVRVQQGLAGDLDQCDGDHLEATLLPPEPGEDRKATAAKADAKKAAGAGGAATKLAATEKAQKKAAPAVDPDDEEAGPATNLALRRVKVTGHAVWLQSTSQHMRGYGNFLKFDRPGRGEPDCIYYYGNRYTEVIQTDYIAQGKDAGKPRQTNTIRTKDITIYRDPENAVPPKIYARGPGTVETRPAGRDEVERFASYTDEMDVLPIDGTEDRRIILRGHPRVRSIAQAADITAKTQMIVRLTPKPKPAGGADADFAVVSADGRPVPSASKDAKTAKPAGSGATAQAQGDGMRIKEFEGYDDVHLVTEAVQADPKATPPRAAAPRKETVARKVFTARFTDAPAVFAPAKPAESNAAPPVAAVAAADPAKEGASPAEGPKPPAKPVDPPMVAVADTVDAVVLQEAGSNKGQVKEAKLAGNALVHQDAAEGKTQGSDLTGQTIYYWNNGENRAKLQAQGTPESPARAVTGARTITGRILQLDQAEDHAWVKGWGRLEMEQADTDFLDDSAPENLASDAPKDARGEVATRAKKPSEKPKKGPLIIEWGADPGDSAAMMQFYGRPLRRDGTEGPAVAIFTKHVRANTDESDVACERLTAYFDAPVPFVREKLSPEEERARKARKEKEPGPQIATMLCEKDVVVRSRKLDPETGFLKDKKIIVNPDSVYYVKSSGEFRAPAPGRKSSPGEVFLYTTGDSDNATGPGSGPLANDRRTVKPVSARADGSANRPKKPETQPQIKLTHVRYQKFMEGRFTPPKDAAPGDHSSVYFEGSVEAMMAKVKDENALLDPDRPPDDFYRLVSRKMTVNVEPPTGKDPKEKDRILLDAQENARALTRLKAITGDRITYDSSNELTYVYGYFGDVQITNADGPGQPYSAGRGRVVMHDHKSGRTDLIDPKSFAIVDPNSGTRSVLVPYEVGPMSGRNVRGFAVPGRPVKPYDPNDPVTRARQLRLPTRSSIERRGFNGR